LENILGCPSVEVRKNSIKDADEAYVYFNPEVVKHKKLPELDKNFIKKCFNREEIKILNNFSELDSRLRESLENTGVLLLMSSGNFGGLNIIDLINQKYSPQ